MDLQQFLDQFASTNSIRDLNQMGPASARVYGRVQNEGKTRALIATNYWRTFLASDAFLRALQYLGASPLAATQARIIIVPRDSIGRYDVLVLDPGLPNSTLPKIFEIGPANFTQNDLFIGARRAARAGISSAIGRDYLDVAQETAFGAGAFNLLLAPQPHPEFLSVPVPSLLVDDLKQSWSTAGLLVECKRSPGIVGVTAALHAVTAANAGVSVNGMPGAIIRSDRLNDCAFIQMASSTLGPVPPTTKVMSGLLPRGQQMASFTGVKSGRRQTVITGWDPQLPNPGPYRQALIYTGRDAQPGDSGAALVTDDDWVVGFAFERSKIGQNPTHCSWVWADSVLKSLDVIPL